VVVKYSNQRNGVDLELWFLKELKELAKIHWRVLCQFFEEAHWFFEFYQKPRTGNAESIFQNLLWGAGSFDF
jgi:hypothetical protein